MAEVSAETLAEAFRQAFNPAVNERLHLQERPPGAPHVRIPCVSPTGARFDAVVASSKSHPHFGRVKALENYRYPETFYFGERVGGEPVPSKVIDGKAREFDGKRMDLNSEQKQTLTRATWIRDIGEYVGKGFDPMIRADLQPEIDRMRKQLEAELAAKTEAMMAAAPPVLTQDPVSPEVEAAIAKAETSKAAKSK